MRGLAAISGLVLIGVGTWMIDPVVFYITIGSILLTVGVGASIWLAAGGSGN
jgi:hypothetical protein